MRLYMVIIYVTVVDSVVDHGFILIYIYIFLFTLFISFLCRPVAKRNQRASFLVLFLAEALGPIGCSATPRHSNGYNMSFYNAS